VNFSFDFHTIVFSLLLRFTTSVYTFGVFKLFLLLQSLYGIKIHIPIIIIKSTISKLLELTGSKSDPLKPTENMVMTRKIGFKSLIFQSVSMAMIYGFSGSDLEPVSSNSFDIVDLMIIIGMCILWVTSKCNLSHASTYRTGRFVVHYLSIWTFLLTFIPLCSLSFFDLRRLFIPSGSSCFL
jgi:hypothetical protein